MSQFKVLKENLGNLHVLRGLCALYVVVYHAKYMLWSGGSEYLKAFPIDNWDFMDKFLFGLDMFSSAGQEMVYIFFLLSGFFISLSISSSNYSYFKFIKVRFTRIYLPFLFSLVLAYCLFALADFITPFDQFVDSSYQLNTELNESKNNLGLTSLVKGVFMNREGVSFFAYNNVYWSLAYELLFYLLIGFCMTESKRWVLFFLFLLVYCINLLVGIPVFGRINTAYFVFFGIGIILHLLSVKYESWLISKKVNKWFVILAIIGSFLGILIFLKVYKIEFLVEFFTISLAILSMYYLLVFGLKKGFIKKVLVYLGEVSYSLYLGHIPFLILGYSILFYFTNEELIYNRTFYWIGSLVVVPLSLVVYYFAEKPSMKLLRRIKKGK